ncbi:hypothetical protein BJ508DRAFT_375813 [Ascobolus immersus RN42]|uniref:Uncharacterized protein n=1 Tax=Ascobolus immersus RN42 TaxID=1160509 RepID=A0A3N4IA48_ASCIM|nr:hypothetical protein BJ508DRAFT_375813 [Ascobolus immersus RN42]
MAEPEQKIKDLCKSLERRFFEIKIVQAMEDYAGMIVPPKLFRLFTEWHVALLFERSYHSGANALRPLLQHLLETDPNLSKRLMNHLQRLLELAPELLKVSTKLLVFENGRSSLRSEESLLKRSRFRLRRLVENLGQELEYLSRFYSISLLRQRIWFVEYATKAMNWTCSSGECVEDSDEAFREEMQEYVGPPSLNEYEEALMGAAHLYRAILLHRRNHPVKLESQIQSIPSVPAGSSTEEDLELFVCIFANDAGQDKSTCGPTEPLASAVGHECTAESYSHTEEHWYEHMYGEHCWVLELWGISERHDSMEPPLFPSRDDYEERARQMKHDLRFPSYTLTSSDTLHGRTARFPALDYRWRRHPNHFFAPAYRFLELCKPGEYPRSDTLLCPICKEPALPEEPKPQLAAIDEMESLKTPVKKGIARESQDYKELDSKHTVLVQQQRRREADATKAHLIRHFRDLREKVREFVLREGSGEIPTSTSSSST